MSKSAQIYVSSNASSFGRVLSDLEQVAAGVLAGDLNTYRFTVNGRPGIQGSGSDERGEGQPFVAEVTIDASVPDDELLRCAQALFRKLCATNRYHLRLDWSAGYTLAEFHPPK